MSIDNVRDEIDDIKEQIADAKQTHDQAEGSTKTYMKQLKDSHNLNSLKAAKDFIKKEEAKLADDEAEVIADFERLRKESGI